MQGTPIHHCKYYDVADLGTPSAPPVNTGGEEGSEHEYEGKKGIMFETAYTSSENGERFDGTKNVLLKGKADSLENNELNEKYINQLVKFRFSYFLGPFSTFIKANIIY